MQGRGDLLISAAWSYRCFRQRLLQFFAVALHFESAVRFDVILMGRRMPCVRFDWNPVLIDLRREVCPSAQWQRKGRQWLMSDTDAHAFIRAAQARLDFVEFVQGAPYRLSSIATHGQSACRLPAKQTS
jgi:hypothetical protein